LTDAGGPTRSIALGRGRVGWRPDDIGWRTALLFMVGSALFALGSVPGYASLVPTPVVGLTFFIGSLFFTTAGYSQFVQTINPPGGDRPWSGRRRLFAVQPGRIDWWACVIQSIGTLWFNINTFEALRQGFDVHQQNLRIWTPDFLGSICFLVASELAIVAVCHKPVCVCRDDRDWWIAIINMVGSIFFMLSALAAFVLPSTSELLDASVANSGTFLGAVCFFWAARLLALGTAPRRPVDHRIIDLR
jgi:hypothetical protein